MTLQERVASRAREGLGNRSEDVLDRILDGASDRPIDDTVVKQLRDEIKTFLFAGLFSDSLLLLPHPALTFCMLW